MPTTFSPGLGDTYLKTGDAAASMKSIRQSLEFSKKKRQAQVDGLMYSQQGAVYMEQGDFSRARSSFEQALEIRVRLAEPMHSSREMRKLSRLYSRFGQNAKAQEFAQRCAGVAAKDKPTKTRSSRPSWREPQHCFVGKNCKKQKPCSCSARTKPGRSTFRKSSAKPAGNWVLIYSLRLDPAKALYYQILGKNSREMLPGANVMAGIQKLMAKSESDREIAKIQSAEAAPDHHRRAGRFPAAGTGGMAALEMEEYPTLGARPLAQP